ncbi:hypothetical protein JD844_017224 [Phrynosoma platyrhinos]|uniref:Flavin-containing monooxygenase n=1 Tax=Phrynosoma platyrhinos TaxID=52577 RepID=A0ABQ7SLM7_PHRPL|nr:hypothetical protein JD844_017224 [Phrynosoma platyrhinos]
MSAFSDFPYPEDFPVFLPNAKLLEYLEMYTKKFGLRRHIQFKTTVISISKCPDFSATGQWDVVTEIKGKQKSAIFDAVMVCIGYLTDPVMISTTRGAWVISRVFDNGYPWDMVFLTRFMNIVRNNLPGCVTRWLIASRLSQWFDHANYGIIPEDRTVMRKPVLNDELPACIISGKITVRPEVKEFKGNAVVFANTPGAEDVDVIVFATGYQASFPFIDESVIKVENNHASLYKYIFPPHLEKPTLSIIGFLRPFGPVMPVVEMQARWVTRVFNGMPHETQHSLRPCAYLGNV